MADDGEHSLFSASGASGWMVCHGKILMETGRRKSSAYADEGTAAHELAAIVLRDRVKGGTSTARDHIGEVIRVDRDGGSREFTVDSEMAENVDTYVDDFMLMSNPVGSIRMVEQRVHYHTWLGVPKAQAFGTSDGVAIVYDAPAIDDGDSLFAEGDELQVHDLKYGKGVRVDAEDNAQLRLYALGALFHYDELADIQRVRMVIHQPRLDHVSEEVITVEELIAWADAPRVAAQQVRKVMALPKGADVLYALKPDPKACRFCDAKAICPALKGEVREAVGGGRAKAEDFSDLTVDPPSEIRDYGGNYLAIVSTKLDLIKQWVAAVAEERDRRLISGQKLDGWKVVQGSQGDRKFEAGAVELHLTKRPAVRELLLTKKLASPAQAEKALKKAHPAEWADLQKFISRAPGGPVVVPASDPRADYVKISASDFEDETEQPASVGASAGPETHPFR